jgi:hypothetical protein
MPMATARKKKTAKRPVPSTGHLDVPKLIRMSQEIWDGLEALAKEDGLPLTPWLRYQFTQIIKAKKG